MEGPPLACAREGGTPAPSRASRAKTCRCARLAIRENAALALFTIPRASADAVASKTPRSGGGERIDRWIAELGLNEYGDPKDTMYAGGNPLFDESTGETADRVEYITRAHPDRPWAEEEEDDDAGATDDPAKLCSHWGPEPLIQTRATTASPGGYGWKFHAVRVDRELPMAKVKPLRGRPRARMAS